MEVSQLLDLVLGDLDYDVLLLFDSCQAVPPRLRSTGNGVVSVLTATGFDVGSQGVAAEVGPHSFTKALIDELGVVFNSFVDGTSMGQPISDVSLHGSLLARLKVHLSSVDKNPDGTLKVSKEGGVAFEPPRRRTPIYRFLSETKNPRPIYLAPFPKFAGRGKQPEDITRHREYYGAETVPPRHGVEEKDIPKVLVRILLQEHSFSVDKFANWLLQAPPEAMKVEIESAYGSLSTLLIVKMPLAIWDLVPRDPAMSLIGYITSPNVAEIINQNIENTLSRIRLGTQPAAFSFAADDEEQSVLVVSAAFDSAPVGHGMTPRTETQAAGSSSDVYVYPIAPLGGAHHRCSNCPSEVYHGVGLKPLVLWYCVSI